LGRIDVIVPCFNYGRFLEQCVNSVLRQEGVDVRVLIIDDASTDNTSEVAAALANEDRRVTFIRHGENKGHIATYNEGLLEWASAEYSLLLSADDALTPGALERAAWVMDRHSEIGMTYGMALMIGEDGAVDGTATVSDDYRTLPGAQFLQWCCENPHNPVPTATAVVRTEVQKYLGGYCAELPHTGDLEMWMRFAIYGPVGILRAMQGYYRCHSKNMARQYYDQMLSDRREMAQTYEHVFAPLSDRFPDSRNWLRAARRGLEERAFRSAGNAFDRADMPEYRAWLDFADEISPDGAHRGRPWRLQVRELLGQTVWQHARPVLSRLRGRPAAASPRQPPLPSVGEVVGWWPGLAE
jgi:glycosyltransferase involved in cell wall biosynthesis